MQIERAILTVLVKGTILSLNWATEEFVLHAEYYRGLEVVIGNQIRS
jgi:hypothetical protein